MPDADTCAGMSATLLSDTTALERVTIVNPIRIAASAVVPGSQGRVA
jgi:hypothetical protein